MITEQEIDQDKQLVRQRLEEEDGFLNGYEIVEPIRDQWLGGEGVVYPILEKMKREGEVESKKEFDEHLGEKRTVWKIVSS